MISVSQYKVKEPALLQMKLAIIVLLISQSSLVWSQEYGHSAGVRLETSSSVTYKQFIKNEHAVELMLSGRNDGVQLSTMYVKHIPMDFSFTRNIFFYCGVGGHVGYRGHAEIQKVIDPQNPEFYSYSEEKYIQVGADGLVGIEYRLLGIPVSLNLDIKPYLTYVGFVRLEEKYWDAAFSIKYIF